MAPLIIRVCPLCLPTAVLYDNSHIITLMPAFIPADPAEFEDWMRRGTRLHAEGQLEQALIAFENALAVAPASVQAASATATLLSALSRPEAAFRVLLSVESLLMEDADGAANLAIVAETCGDLARAHKAYQRALALHPAHLRSLNNLGLLAAAQSQWDLAIDYAERCVAVDRAEPSHLQNLSDFLAGARRYAQALVVLEAASQRFPEHRDITIRRVAVLAFHGELEKSRALAATLDGPAHDYLLSFVSPLLKPGEPKRLHSQALPLAYDPLPLFTSQAYEAMLTCDWRGNGKLSTVLRDSLDPTTGTGHQRDFRDAQFYGLTLGLAESELAQLHQGSRAAIASGLHRSVPTFKPGRKVGTRLGDTRIHVGLAVPSLGDPLQRRALQQQLALHNPQRFAIHVYACTPLPDLAHSEALSTYAASVVETAHLSDEELVGRIRLDQLDVFVDKAFFTFRPEVLASRIAPVQIPQPSWNGHHAHLLYDYILSDPFIHPDGLDLAPCGAVLRLPNTCWLAVHGDHPETARSLWAPGSLAAEALVLCSRFAPGTLDPQTFAAWMAILRGLPDAVLYLPGCNAAVAANLVREALAAGVDTTRLVFADADNQPPGGDRTRRPDLFLDPLRCSAAEGLEEALRMGVPAISCAGNAIASRMGGSMLQAAGLPDCVLDSPQAYVTEAAHLGRDAKARRRLQQRLQTVTPTAALFDVQARVGDWETAWAWMTERSRAGLPPVAFNLPPSPLHVPGVDK